MQGEVIFQASIKETFLCSVFRGCGIDSWASCSPYPESQKVPKINCLMDLLAPDEPHRRSNQYFLVWKYHCTPPRSECDRVRTWEATSASFPFQPGAPTVAATHISFGHRIGQMSSRYDANSNPRQTVGRKLCFKVHDPHFLSSVTWWSQRNVDPSRYETDPSKSISKPVDWKVAVSPVFPSPFASSILISRETRRKRSIFPLWLHYRFSDSLENIVVM